MLQMPKYKLNANWMNFRKILKDIRIDKLLIPNKKSKLIDKL